jgi:formylglycine-generating enzyme required for sulfatase activity
MLVQLGQADAAAAARMAGFGFQEADPPAPAQAYSAPAAPAAPAPAPVNAPAPRVPVCDSHYSATLSRIDARSADDDYEQRQNAVASAPEPDQPPAPPPPPPWQALSSTRRLVVLAEKHLRSQHTINQWDCAKLARQLAQGLPLAPRRARQQRLRWRDNALVLAMRNQTEPLHDDYRQLLQIVQRRSGGRVAVYLHYAGQGWAQYVPHALPQLPSQPWQSLPHAPSLSGVKGLLLGWPNSLPNGLPDLPLQWQPQAILAAWRPPTLAPATAQTLAHLPLAVWDGKNALPMRRQYGLMQVSKPQLDRLLAVLTLAVVVHAPLLRALRILLDLPACAEVRAWASPDVACNGVAIAVLSSRREAYRTILLAQIPLPLRQHACALIALHHASLSFEITLEEAQLAELYAPGAQVLASAAWFAHIARAFEQVQQGQPDDAAAERRAYLARQGQRTGSDVWRRAPEFTLAWSLANRDAVLRGKGLPPNFDLTLLPRLRQRIAGQKSAKPAAQQNVRLLQVGDSLLLQAVDLGSQPAGGPGVVLAQWESAMVVQWKRLNAQEWSRPQAVPDMAPINLKLCAPLELTDGVTSCIVRHVPRPPWALEWGRDRAGLYALAPSRTGKPVRVPYPQPLPVQIDETGLFVVLTVHGANGQHRQVFRYIEAGEFVMGSPVEETAMLDNHVYYENEYPQERVTISQGFWLADTACTQGFWQALMEENPSRFHENNQGGPDHPVEQVSWNMIQPFLRRLQALLPDCCVTLPTEAEWEYACRAGTGTPFSFGTTISTAQVNHDGNYPYGAGEKGEWRGHTVAVKELIANAWGLYQMHGNVWEWCADAPRTYTGDAVCDPGLAHALLTDIGLQGALRVLRGGSWIGSARGMRSAIRFFVTTDGLGSDAGFRLVLRSARASGC